MDRGVGRMVFFDGETRCSFPDLLTPKMPLQIIVNSLLVKLSCRYNKMEIVIDIFVCCIPTMKANSGSNFIK